MKKTNILILLLAISTCTYAQKESFFRIGAKAGVNVNKITGLAYKEGFNYNFQVGLFTQFNITKRLGIQPELNFVQSETEFTNDANTIYDDLFGGGLQHKAKLTMLELPVLLNINIGPTQKVKLQLGPAYSGVLKQNVDSLKNNVKDIYKNGEVSGIAGIWIQLPAIVLSARYKVGFTDMNNTLNGKEWKNQAIQVSAGFTF
jgi:Outer membrane protein beta-barrel domain